MRMSKSKLKVLFVIISLIITVAFFMTQNFFRESYKKNHAHQYYQSLMQGQETSDPEKLIKEARVKKNSTPIYLIVYKRSCSRCQKYQSEVREKVGVYRKEGATILVAEAPEKGDVSSYPSWIKNFKLPQAKTPVIIKYDVSLASSSNALDYKEFQVYSKQKEMWITE